MGEQLKGHYSKGEGRSTLVVAHYPILLIDFSAIPFLDIPSAGRDDHYCAHSFTVDTHLLLHLDYPDSLISKNEGPTSLPISMSGGRCLR